jgi:hypothetical protein
MRLIKPMEAAAADSPKVRVGSTQKGGGNAYPPAVVRHSQVRTIGKLWPGTALRVKKLAARIKGIAA